MVNLLLNIFWSIKSGTAINMVALYGVGEQNLLTKAEFSSVTAYYTIIVGMIVVAYFVGNISPATIIGKIQGVDIKKEGSGNAGATNVIRVLGVKAGALTLIIDIIKGVLVVLLGRAIGGEYLAMIVVLPVMIGHIWPIVFKFKGGKGVATVFGAMVALCPSVGLLAVVVVIVVVLVGRRISLGSIIGSIFLPVLVWYFIPAFLIDSIVMMLIILFKHRENIIRIAKGEEPKISFDKVRRKK